MSIKNLFNKKNAFYDNADSGSSAVESRDYIITKNEKDRRFIPNIDFASASNFSKFGSAEVYYDYSVRRIYNDYPYDGSRNEKLLFDLSSSYLDRWVFNNKYPKSTGYINFSYGGWGTAASITDGYGIPNSSDDYEYIFVRGGMHTASSGMIGKPLHKTFNKSVVYDSDKDRTTTFVLEPTEGHTVEFWLKKEEFDLAKTKKEVILDLWNGEVSSSDNYGRFTLELSGTGIENGHSSDTFRLTYQSGSKGFFDLPIGTVSVTTSSLSSWHHYAFSFVSGANCIVSRMYVDGDLNEKKNLGSDGLGAVPGLINGYIGALQTIPSNSSGTSAAQYAGKLSASVDELRFWKTRRTSEQIHNNWHRQVGGGTNTDDANVKLGLYYKFNEGIVGDSSYDSVVLDYSGRIANGTWTGYTAGSRNTGSAFLSSSHAIVETSDPIIRSVHPNVVSVKSELEQSGSEWDAINPTMLYNKTVPDWIKHEDEDTEGKNVKFLYQIISSYFDTLYSQITSISNLKKNEYPLEQGKAIPFAKKLLDSNGFVSNDIFLNSTLLERVEGIDNNNNHLEKDIFEIKNLIYTNLYNNLDTILKSKGNEKSIRNTLRCFGIDDELVKLNIYTDGGTHYFKDQRRHTSLMKKYISFNHTERFESTIFQTSSVNNSLTFITGSETKEVNSAFTAEVSVIFPEKPNIFESSHFVTPFVSSSIFGMHSADKGLDVDSSYHYSWDADDIANFQVYVTRDKKNSPRAKFVLKTNDNRTILSSSYFSEVYTNQNWNLAVRVKPQKYPFVGNVVEHNEQPLYQIELYGINHAFGTVQSEFLVSASLDNTSGSAFLSKSKRFYVGAHKTNFTGSVLEKSDIKIGGFRYYLDYLSDASIRQHNLDPTSFGMDETYRSSTMFAEDMTNKHVISSDLIAINWDFETVTTSDSSGEFTVDDVSSGSSDSRYGWIDNVSRVENRGYGHGFPTSNTDIIRNEILFANKKQLPETSYTSDKVILEDEERRYFIKDDDVSDNFYSLEKSMSQVISDEMLKMLSSIVEFNTLIGKGVDRYRVNYKNLDTLRRLFYEKVEEDPDFDKFTRYYKWIDSSISALTSQLFPASARNSGQIFDIIESHIFERSKYQNKFPLVKEFTATEAPMRGSSEMRYNWKFGHAPVDADGNKNQTWQKLRKERSDLPNREELRKVIITEKDVNNITINKAKSDLTRYEGSTFALRRLSKPYRISQDLHPTIHGGINYPPKKDRDLIYHLTQRHGPKGNFLQPLNTVVAGAGTGNGIKAQQEKDTLNPNLKTRVHLDVIAGRYSNDLYNPRAKDEDSIYAHRTSELDLPVTVISQVVSGGYNSKVIHGFDSASIVTNIHSDTTTPTNHIPMQGPFTETWVGGHQHRHVAINKYDTSLRDDDTGGDPLNNLDNKYTRAEGWRIKLGDYINKDGAIGFVGPDYGGPYPDPARKSAVFYREERAKRPVNIKNIRYSTGSKNIGNFKENYELISAAGKMQNNLYLRKNPEQSNFLPTSIGSTLPLTTHPMSLFGQWPNINGNVFGTHVNNRQPDKSSLTYAEAVVGQKASGSIKLYGVDRLRGGDVLHLTKSSDSVVKRFVIGDASDGGGAFYITGSTDVDLWHDFRNTFESNFSSYEINSSSVAAVTGATLWSTASQDNSYLTASVTNFTASEYTFAGWFYLDPVDNSQMSLFATTSPIGSGLGSECHVMSTGDNGHLRYRVHYTNADGSSNQTIAQWRMGNWREDNESQWMHLAFVFKSSSASGETGLQDLPVFYKNAVSQSWTAVSSDAAGGAASAYGYSALPNTINKLWLYTEEDVGNGWKGGMNDVMWFNTALSAADIDTLYNCRVSLINSSTASLPSASYCASWWPIGNHHNDPAPLSGGVANIEDDHVQFYDVMGNNNLRTVQAATPRLHWSVGMPQSASYATFNITASETGDEYNQTISVTDSSCSWGINSQLAGGVTAVAEINSYVVGPVVTSSVTNTIISTRFSAPGGIEIQSPAYLDVYSREYSVYNALPFRNLTVRGSGSGEDGTIRSNTHMDKRDGLRTLLSRRTGKFGTDSQHGTISSANYDTSPSFHKVHGNIGRKPTDSSTIETPVFNNDHDNAHIGSLIPRSDFQYSWVTSSLGYNYGILSGSTPYTGRQRIYGFAPLDGMVSSSVTINGERGVVAAITFPTASEIFGIGV
jgi:hypothetical protein